ncbi:MAG: GNAT family N-acetyltransferase [Propionibacteriaceae bacterium]|jgi:phosphinothricin acetyltransferase|nr:GNAT family N-acetyltransferase [Propionibacteriaceae bacterium]
MTVVRPWVAGDLAATRSIFNEAVATTTAAWNWEPVGEAEWAEWCGAHTAGRHSLFVAEADGSVVGFGGVGPFRERAGYKLTGEDTVYVAPGSRGQGVGAALLAETISAARAKGLHAVVGALDSNNPASVALHARFGFTEVGRLPQVGHKFGRWLDLVLVELLLDDRALPPET